VGQRYFGESLARSLALAEPWLAARAEMTQSVTLMIPKITIPHGVVPERPGDFRGILHPSTSGSRRRRRRRRRRRANGVIASVMIRKSSFGSSDPHLGMAG